MTLGDVAFQFEPVQEELFQIAFRRDGGAVDRWRSLVARESNAELMLHRRRRLLPLVEHRFREIGVPTDVEGRAFLRSEYLKATAEHQRRVEWLTELLQQFDRAGIETMLLKGLAIATLAYPVPEMRGMGDVDVLIRTRDLDAATRLLESSGWTARKDLDQNPNRRRREMDYRGPNGENLDFHWHLHPSFVAPGEESPADEAFFARSVPLRVGDATTRMLDATDALLHVLVHGAYLGWSRHPIWVADAVMLIEHTPSFDGERFRQLVHESNVALPVARAVTYLDARLDCVPRFGGVDPVPEIVRWAQQPLLRQRRIYAQVMSWPEPPTWLRYTLGPLAATYNYWAVQTMTWSRRDAVREFPGWLVDAWGLPGPAALPRGAWARVRERQEESRGG